MWPDTVIGAYGECDICGKIDYCNDNPDLSPRILSLPKISLETVKYR